MRKRIAFKPRVRACVHCTMVRFINGRDLCRTCYGRAWRRGTLHLFERQFYPADEVACEVAHLRPEGYTTAQIAERLHLSPSGLRKAIARARPKAGVSNAA